MQNRERGRRANRRRHLGRGLVAILVAAACAATAQADQGAVLYKTLCASCHGADGRGDGPAAGALTPPPPDLTKSTLNLTELMRIIDGRRTVRAHGNADMPVWGKVIEQALEGSGRQHRDALRQVQMLAEHVRSIEGKAGSSAN